jgi:hypothetical protein
MIHLFASVISILTTCLPVAVTERILLFAPCGHRIGDGLGMEGGGSILFSST